MEPSEESDDDHEHVKHDQALVSPTVLDQLLTTKGKS